MQRSPVALEDMAQEALGDDTVIHYAGPLTSTRIRFDRLNRTRLDVSLRLASGSSEPARIRIYRCACLLSVAFAARLSLPFALSHLF